jgi:hypothetical protein
VQLKHSERRVLEDALDMGSGYVLNFSDRTFAEFFDDQGITIYQGKYGFNGTSRRTDAIDRFARDQTLDELVDSIERDIGANRPAAALDRLHTYCMKKFGHFLDVRGVAWERAEPLHSRVGKYVKALGQDRPLRDVSAQRQPARSAQQLLGA